jgi:uncharacterized protein YerC
MAPPGRGTRRTAGEIAHRTRRDSGTTSPRPLSATLPFGHRSEARPPPRALPHGDRSCRWRDQLDHQMDRRNRPRTPRPVATTRWCRSRTERSPKPKSKLYVKPTRSNLRMVRHQRDSSLVSLATVSTAMWLNTTGVAALFELCVPAGMRSLANRWSVLRMLTGDDEQAHYQHRAETSRRNDKLSPVIDGAPLRPEFGHHSRDTKHSNQHDVDQQLPRFAHGLTPRFRRRCVGAPDGLAIGPSMTTQAVPEAHIVHSARLNDC